jgi:hypothetical protein
MYSGVVRQQIESFLWLFIRSYSCANIERFRWMYVYFMSLLLLDLNVKTLGYL